MLTAVNERLDEFFTFLERRRLPPLLVAIICVSVFFANWLTPLVLSPDSYTYIYAVATALWVWALVRIELSLAYPLMALGFVLLPLVSVFIFKEPLTPINFAGLALISVGVVLSQIR